MPYLIRWNLGSPMYSNSSKAKLMMNLKRSDHFVNSHLTFHSEDNFLAS